MVGFRFIPLMVSRIMLSLKKAADLSQTCWSLAQETSGSNTFQSVLVFGPPLKGSIKEEGIAISVDIFRKS